MIAKLKTLKNSNKKKISFKIVGYFVEIVFINVYVHIYTYIFLYESIFKLHFLVKIYNGSPRSGHVSYSEVDINEELTKTVFHSSYFITALNFLSSHFNSL